MTGVQTCALPICDKVSGDITKLQEENAKLKEDIIFYEKIVGKKR